MAGLPAGAPIASATGRWPANGSEASSITAKLDAAETSSMTLIYSPCCQRVDRSIPTVPAEPAAGVCRGREERASRRGRPMVLQDYMGPRCRCFGGRCQSKTFHAYLRRFRRAGLSATVPVTTAPGTFLEGKSCGFYLFRTRERQSVSALPNMGTATLQRPAPSDR